jgi:GNAT superfamily N-acetyltransferase
VPATHVAIRPYQADDYEACRRLWVELTERHRLIYDDPTIGGDDPGAGFDSYLATPARVESWVAESDAAVVGLTGLFVDGDGGEVEPVVVTERVRSRGIGRQLIGCAVEEARTRALANVSIRPVARNVEAIALFHQLGFRAVGRVDLFMDLDTRTRRPGIDLHGLPYDY